MHVRRPATLASLAAELGVSRTTVSNAYNRPDQLSPELRRRVLDTARRLGYPGPDPVARSLRTRKAGAVGLLLTENLSYAFRDPAAIGFLEGLALACEDAGTGLLLVPAGDDVLRFVPPLIVTRKQVDEAIGILASFGFWMISPPATRGRSGSRCRRPLRVARPRPARTRLGRRTTSAHAENPARCRGSSSARRSR